MNKKIIILILLFLLIILSFYGCVAQNNYEIIDGEVYKINHETGERFLTKKHFEEDFEDASSIHDLIGLERRWTSFTLQSPSAKTVQEYVKLRNCVLARECDFIDNRIDVSSEKVHEGDKSLRMFSVGPSSDMTTSKTSLESELMFFVEGDDLWYSAWYYVEEGMPLTLVDFENTHFKEWQGPRVIIKEDKFVALELKYGFKPTYKQVPNQKIEFPKNQWVHLKVHLKLSHEEDGIIEIWQGDAKIIDTNGKTLPTSNSFLDNLEIGISATQQVTIVYVDDVIISHEVI